MIRTCGNTLWSSMVHCGFGLLTVLLIGWSAAPASAETLVLRNDCNAPIVVQAVSVFRGVFRRDRPYLLRAGDTTPGIVLPGDKIITVYDAKVPNRVLFQGTVSGGLIDRHFRILPPPPRVRMQLLPPSRP